MVGKNNWRARILDSTRGRVVALLRRSASTVSDLAAALELTDNAVRLHLSALERDGLVEQYGRRREWIGKPAQIYRTTAEAEALFPKPYDQVLSELLAVLEERNSDADVEELLRTVGGRLGRAASSGDPDLSARVQHAGDVLNSLGGLVEVHEDERGFTIQGYSCPLAELTAAHPLTCRMAETLVSEVVGAQAVECCSREDRPRCAFRIDHG